MENRDGRDPRGKTGPPPGTLTRVAWLALAIAVALVLPVVLAFLGLIALVWTFAFAMIAAWTIARDLPLWVRHVRRSFAESRRKSAEPASSR